MEILVNSEKLDYTLEDEKHLGEIVDGIVEWCRTNGLLVTAIAMGARNLREEPRQKWAGIPIAQVGRLEVSADLLKEVQLENLQTVFSYIDMLSRAIEEKDSGKINELLEGQSYMLESLGKVQPSAGSAAADQTTIELKRLLAGSSAEVILAWPPAVAERARTVLDTAKQKVSARYEELRNPKQALRTAASQLTDVMKDIGKISVMLQTGEDQKAMSFIVQLSDVSQAILRLMAELEDQEPGILARELIGGLKTRDFFESLNSVLRELVEAFDARDTVLIADLLEYEVGPRFGQLTDYLTNRED